MKSARMIVFLDASGSWRWRVRAKNGRLIATSGESFASRGNARRAARSLLRTLQSEVPIVEDRARLEATRYT